MRESQFNTPDGATIFTREWLPAVSPKAVVIIVHGYAEHCGRYAHVAEHLNQHGYAVYGLDHRGHGKSSGERVFFANMMQPVTDLRQFHEHLRAQYPNLPFFMFGHSMGSVIALLYTLHYQRDLSGLIVSGTATNAEETSNAVVIGIGQVVGTLAPKLRFVPALPSTVLTTDVEMQKRYDDDPLNDRGAMRGSLAKHLINAGRDIRARAKEITLPLLVLHGEDDQLTPISGSYAVHGGASSTDKTLLTYPNMRHEIVNERDRERVLNDIADWLSKH